MLITLLSTIKSQSKPTLYLGRRHTLVSIQRRKGDITRSVDQILGRDKHTDRDVTSLLDDLDLHAQPGDLDLRTVAEQDCLFIKHDSHLTSLPRSLDKLYDILALTAALVDRLQNRSGSSIQRKRKGADDDVVCDDFKCDKYVANLEHLLRCLKQTALDAIIRHYLKVVEAHILHWHHHWQYQKRIDEGWFAEWPNGQRPLSTMWPWNVKPSLLVLWGVCWMFYGSSAYNNSYSRPTRNRGGTEPLSEDFWTRHSGQPQPQLTQQHNATYNYPSQPRQQYVTHPNTSTISETSEECAGPASNSHPSSLWLHPPKAGAQVRRANDPGHDSRAQSRDYPPMTIYSHAENQGNPLYQAIISASPYIKGTSSVSSDLFPAVCWPYSQGINQDQPSAYAPSYTPWQSKYNSVENITASAQRSRSDPSFQSYGPPQQVANPQAAARGLGSLGFGLGLQMHDITSYPSPHSDVSGQMTSSCLSVLPRAMTSPSMPLVVSPSVAGSSNSRHSSRRSQEPPRNMEGMMYCDNPECADNPPVFPRKCEWR